MSIANSLRSPFSRMGSAQRWPWIWFMPVLALILSAFLATASGAHAQMRVHFIDVGQGDAILIDSPGAAMLIDGGEDNGLAAAYLRRIGIERLDVIVATHAHADHIGALPAIIEEFEAEAIWYNGQTHTTWVFEHFIDMVLSSNLAYHEPVRGEDYIVGDLHVEILHPAGSLADSDASLNDGSMTMRVRHDGVSILLTGDIEQETEAEILASGVDLKADILKVAHHGSRSSSTSRFIDAVEPVIAVYQAGDGNSYGHPHDEVRRRFDRRGIPLVGTDVHGTVVLVAGDGSIEVTYPDRPAGAAGDGRKTQAWTPTRPERTGSGLAKPGLAGPGANGAPEKRAGAGCIDINRASRNEMKSIIHIGDARAEAIVRGRPWKTLEGLTRIHGIGAGRLADIVEEGLACIPVEG